MAAGENQVMDAAAKGPIHMRRNIGRKKGSKGRNRPNRGVPGGVGDSRKPKKIGVKMKNLFRKRARDYNSDGEGGEEEDDDDVEDKRKFQKVEEMSGGGDSSEEAEEEDGNRKEHREDLDDGLSDGNEEEDGDIQPGVTKFTEGCRAFKMAFMSIIKKAIQDDGLGPILSAHKKLVAEKLAEEDAEKKVKKEVRKEKHLMGEKGHVIPANYLDAHEKFLIGVATKGVVKLFNAVNKAQHAQKGLDPSRSKDAKVLRKRRKEAFFSELGKIPSTAKAQTSSGQADGEAPGWAPLRDNYMLTSSKLKGWDKMPDNAATDDIGKMSEDSSSDGDD